MNRPKTIEIRESGMTFGPFREETIFHIERSRLYGHVNRGEGGVPTAEFVLLPGTASSSRNGSLWIVEAKSSSPRPQNQKEFRDFIEDIKQKFDCSLSLVMAAFLGRHASNSDIPRSFLEQDLSLVTITLILVIHGHEKKWLEPVSDALQKALKASARIWNFPPDRVVVLNDEMARERGFVQ